MSDQSQRQPTRPSDMLEPVHAGKEPAGTWTEYLVLFLRIMAAVSLIKGLYHWAQVCGIGARAGRRLSKRTPWRGSRRRCSSPSSISSPRSGYGSPPPGARWCGSPRWSRWRWSRCFSRNVYGGSMFVVLVEVALLGVYLWLAIVSARERPA